MSSSNMMHLLPSKVASGDTGAAFDVIEPEKLIDQHMKIKFNLKIESIFVGKTALSIQIKLWSACVSTIELKMRKMFKVGFRKPKANDNVVEEEVSIPTEDDYIIINIIFLTLLENLEEMVALSCILIQGKWCLDFKVPINNF